MVNNANSRHHRGETLHTRHTCKFVGDSVHPPTPWNLPVIGMMSPCPPATLATEISLPADSLLTFYKQTVSRVQAEEKKFWRKWRRAGQSDIERQLPYKYFILFCINVCYHLAVHFLMLDKDRQTE